MTASLAYRILLSRRDLDWNQEKLATKAGLSRGYISDLERGKVTNPTLDVIEALADAMGLSRSYLAGWDEDPLGEGASMVKDGRIVYQVQNAEEYRRVQQVIDEIQDLAPEDQELALSIIRQVARSRRVARVIG